MISMKKRYLVDLFAGCGGLSLGLENAGFYPLLVNELADEARETYLVNRKGLNFKHFEECPLDNAEEPWVWKDVTNLRKYLEEEFRSFAIKVRKTHGIDINQGELDLVVGGPPCQGYSGIGHRRSYPVDKKHMLSNHMYHHMLDINHQVQKDHAKQGFQALRPLKVIEQPPSSFPSKLGGSNRCRTKKQAHQHNVDTR